jgi:uncharacterized protein (DUF1800 family)
MSGSSGSEARAALALSRYGFGARPGDLARVAADPLGWLRSQLTGPPVAPVAIGSTQERLAAVFAARGESTGAAETLIREQGRDWHLADLTARTAAAIESESPFIERLVHFWANHFTISTAKPVLMVAAAGYEQEAIRPHVLGRFGDMLRAVVEHPVMLIYLDNAQSVGPDSRVGERRDMGLNENLAREVLELHTLGVDGGYTQADVRAFAEILTGWSVAKEGDSDAGSFRYRPAIHQPGSKILLGTTYPEGGQDEGIAALDALSRHPATARHLAAKLAGHFIADEPPASAIDWLSAIFLATDGDLAAMAGALVDLFDQIPDPLGKVKTPHDLVIAALRAFDGADYAHGGVLSMRVMGHFPFSAPSPAGWPDRAEDWLGPDALMKRIDWAVEVGRRMPAFVSPVRIAQNTIWPLSSEASRFQIEMAPSVADGIALLLASPEFQRR